MTNVKELMQTLSEKIGVHADARKVYGEPVTSEGRTVIPVASVKFGFGAGSGQGPKKGESEVGGGGGGGGLGATPVGAIEISASGTRFIRFNAWQPLAIAAAAGFALGLVAGLSVKLRR